MSWNTTLFMLLNAPEQPGVAMLLAAKLAASGPVLLPPVLLTCLWVWGTPNRRPALLATAAGLFVGQALNMLIGLAWYEPRPFMAGVGHTWIAHVPDNGFPSDHATLGWTLGLGMALTGASRGWGAVACLVAIVAGWARVYLGVHFPMDVLASIPVGMVAALTARLLLPAAAWIAPPAERLYEALIRWMPPWLPVPRSGRT